MENNVKKLAKNNTLCNNNLQVKFYLNNIKKRLRELKVKDEEISELLNNSLEVLRTMKKQGQSMENRLKLFNYAICKILGYKRDKKQKKEEVND